MNTRLKPLAIAALLAVPTVTFADSACSPQVMESPTRFPMRAQLRGQAGTVHLDLTIDRSGRTSSIDLIRSSGFRLLDRAARESAKDWRFDVSDCVRKDLPATQRVAIEYRNDEYQ